MKVGQLAVDGVEDLARQAVRFEQVAELEQGGGVGRILPVQVNANKTPDRLVALGPLAFG